MSQHILEKLYEVILSRKDAAPEESYVASLLAKGTEAISAKITEEAEEVVVEALARDSEKLRAESADLLFHLMVLWADQGVSPEEVFKVLEKRLGTSGLEEKASR